MLTLFLTIENEDDRDKITKLYKLYSGTMLYVANNILQDIHLAEDAVSEAFIKIMNNLEKINEVDSYRTRGFIVIIVRNIALDILRKRKRVQLLPLDDYSENMSYTDPAFDNLTTKEACDKLTRCIGSLSKNYSDILYLKIELDCSYDEIGNILNISPENAKIRLHRARKALIALLEKEGKNYD